MVSVFVHLLIWCWVALGIDVKKRRIDEEMHSTAVPAKLIQYAQRRTASTVQYKVLCAIMLLLHEDEASEVKCGFKEDIQLADVEKKKYVVLKTHTVPNELTAIIPKYAPWFFTSVRAIDDGHNKSHTIQNPFDVRIKYKYTQTMETLLLSGDSRFTDYESIFGLNKTQMNMMVEYMDLMVILRECCGAQMSGSWVTFVEKRRQKSMDEHHHHECERYNLENIEKALLDSRIYNLFSQYDNEIASISNWDNKLDGNYCKQTNAKLYAGAYVHVSPEEASFLRFNEGGI